jgi:hypothetical protein
MKEIKLNFKVTEQERKHPKGSRLCELRVLLDEQEKNGQVDPGLLDEFCQLAQEVYKYED